MNSSDEKMRELLADQALFGLTDEEKTELSALKSGDLPNDDESFEMAAAAYHVASLDDIEPAPESLLEKLSADANQYFEAESAAESETPSTVREVVFDKPNPSISQWLGWLVAGAACIALAVSLWFGSFGQVIVAENDPKPVEKVPTVNEKRESLLAAVGESLKLNWDSPQADIPVSGDVVWNENKQEGYMKLEGLPVNDRDKSTYQLWIFDEAQGDETPVDGGVFDISKDGEAIVPIDPKIAVKGAKMFAITVEKPGGVVVSKREKIVALAKIS